MDLKPVNSINNDSNTIRVSDGNSPIRLIFKDVKGEVINLYDKIDYFYLTKDDEKFYSVTDISYDGDEVIIRLPKLRKGQYRAEIRDKDGSIYPANEDLYILLRRSFEDDKDIYYFGHREDILNSVEPMVIQHIEENPDKFRGERGQQGFPGRDGLPGIDGKDGKDGIDGEKGDPGKDGIDGVKGEKGVTKDNQSNFLEMLSKNNNKILYKILRDRRFDVFIPQYGEYGTMYRFFKNTNEDFIRMGFADYSRMELIDGYYQNKNYDVLNGTWDLRNSPNYFTTEVGATVELEFEGTGIDFLHFTDNRGGVFEFSVDGEIVKSISTHIDAVPSSELVSNYAIRSVVKGLENKKHILVGTFKGADTSNPPVGTARGWMRYAPSHLLVDNNYTFHVHGPVHQETKIKNIIHSGSVKEFAFSVNDGNDNVAWIPEHNSKGSTRALSQEILIDGVKVTDFTEMKHFGSADIIEISQELIGFHPNNPDVDICNIFCNHNISSEDISLLFSLKWLKDTLIHDGYSMMLPVLNNSSNKLFTSNGYSLVTNKTDNTFETISEGINSISSMFTSIDDYVSILKVSNTDLSFRKNKKNENKSFLQIQNRIDMNKLYPTIYTNESVMNGDKYSFNCHYKVGKIGKIQTILDNF